jgi:hypothetical protein
MVKMFSASGRLRMRILKYIFLAFMFITAFIWNSQAHASEGDIRARAETLMRITGLDGNDLVMEWGLPGKWENEGYVGVAECKPEPKIYLKRGRSDRVIMMDVLPHEVAHLYICSKYGTTITPNGDKHGPEWHDVHNVLIEYTYQRSR